MHGWGFVNDNGKAGSGRMVFGPTGQPLGAGSAELTLTQSIDGWALATGNHEGTKVAGIVSLDYSTFTRNIYATTVQLTVNNPSSDLLFPGYHRLVFEPSVTPGSVTPNQWQRWSPTGAMAKWWITRNKTALCTQASPCTWAQIKALFPTSTINGGVWLKAGSGWPAGLYNVDAFLFIAASPLAGVLYDFEPERGDSNNGD
jgi:hypothetical protein